MSEQLVIDSEVGHIVEFRTRGLTYGSNQERSIRLAMWHVADHLKARIAQLEAALQRIAPAPDPEVHPPCACGYDDPADVCASHAPLKDSYPEIVAWFQRVGAHISTLEGRAENAEATLDTAKLELEAVREQRALLIDEAERREAALKAANERADGNFASAERLKGKLGVMANERDALRAELEQVKVAIAQLWNLNGPHAGWRWMPPALLQGWITWGKCVIDKSVQLEQENARLRESECAECGRALPPDGDCWGCQADQLVKQLNAWAPGTAPGALPEAK